jgi:hypothetical protein
MTRRVVSIAAVLAAALLAPAARAAGHASATTGEAPDHGLPIYVVALEGLPLATYAGETPPFAATSPAAIGAARLDTDSLAARAYSSATATS